MVSTPVTMLSATKHAPIASWDVSYDCLTQEVRLKSKLLLVLHGIQAPSRNGHMQHYNPFLWQPWKGYLHSGVSGNTQSYILYRRENGQMCNYSLIHGGLPINCLEVQGLGKSIIRKLVEKDIWGRSLWTELSKWTKDVKILVSHANRHQKVTSVRMVSIIK